MRFSFFSVLFIISFYILFFIIASPLSFAQSRGGYDAYDVIVSKIGPTSGEYVDLTIRSNKSFSSDIQSVRWYVDGVERKGYENKFKLTEIVGSSVKQVTAYIRYFDVLGERRYAEITRWIRPVIFDILWEADSVVTPLYNGHKLAGPGVPIILSAKIQYTDQNNIVYTEEDFSYRWMIESRYHDDRGPGVSSVTYEEGGNYFNRHIIVKAEVTLIGDSTVSFEKTINVPIVEPRVLVYPHTLLYGLSRNLVVSENLQFGTEEVTASVYPFYFSRGDFDKNAIQYKWFINNSPNYLKEGRKVDISVEGREGTLIPVRILAQNENEDLQQTDTVFSFRL